MSRVFLSFFILLITEFAHTSPLTHEACPFRSSLLTCGTLTCSARFRSSIQQDYWNQFGLRIDRCRNRNRFGLLRCQTTLQLRLLYFREMLDVDGMPAVVIAFGHTVIDEIANVDIDQKVFEPIGDRVSIKEKRIPTFALNLAESAVPRSDARRFTVRCQTLVLFFREQWADIVSRGPDSAAILFAQSFYSKERNWSSWSPRV